MNILLVEDEAGIRDALASFLRLKGHRVVTAASRDEGLACIRDESVDLLITDWRIGDDLGGALVVASGCPSIVVSGNPDEVLDLGERVTVLRKPVLPHDVLRTIESFAEEPKEAVPHTDALDALPCDTRDRITLALALAGATGPLAVEDDGAFVRIEAELVHGDAATKDLEAIGGDLCVRRGPAGLRFTLRLHRDGRPDEVERVLRLADDWPPASESFAIDCDGEDPRGIAEFLSALARARRLPRGRVCFLNVPPAWRMWLEISGRADDMPKRPKAGPRLPEFLAMLWG